MENSTTQNPPEENKTEQPVETVQNTTEEESSKVDADQKKEMEAFREFLRALNPKNEYNYADVKRKYEQLTRERIFWDTQPVPKFTEINNPEFKEGEIEIDNKVENVPKEPFKLLEQFEWCDVDLTKEEELNDVYNFLYENYVEDEDNMFRFDYSKEFLKWALTPPGYFPEWHIGVRVSKNKKLVGFITGIPVHVHANQGKFKAAEINFLCVHKKLRSNRLAPVLIKEVTRRVHLKNQWQAIYTAGTLIPTPITQARYYHRSLNPKKLIDVKFSSLPPNQTMSRMIKLYKLPEETKIPGLREFKTKDIPAVTKLLNDYLKQFKVYLRFTQDEVKHWFLGRKDVIYTYVVEKDKNITDLISFYCLPSSILKHEKYNQLKAAYCFYNIATSVTWPELFEDALILANREGFDVFNALNIMDNEKAFSDLKFSMGDGNLHYYLYNWRLSQPLAPHEMGVTLL